MSSRASFVDLVESAGPFAPVVLVVAAHAALGVHGATGDADALGAAAAFDLLAAVLGAPLAAAAILAHARIGLAAPGARASAARAALSIEAILCAGLAFDRAGDASAGGQSLDVVRTANGVAIVLFVVAAALRAAVSRCTSAGASRPA